MGNISKNLLPLVDVAFNDLKKFYPFLQIILIMSAISCKLPAQSSVRAIDFFANTAGSDTVKSIVTLLEAQLQKSNKGVRFNVRPVSEYKGLGICLVNLSSEKLVLPGIAKAQYGTPEKFTIASNSNSVLITGNSNLALQHAVFAWLEKLGFHYYFPHPDWYIIPANANIFQKLSYSSSPSFNHRRIFYEWGTGSPKADSDFIFWQLANKMGGTLNASFGHAYDDIVDRNKEVFKQHPEWFYPVPAKGILPADPKFDMSREDLVQFIIQDVQKRLEAAVNKNQPIKMVSLSASDGRGTCNSPGCQKLGTFTDRVYYLVNRVAKAIRTKYPGTFIGCLAYDEYGEPPTIKLEPNVYVGITTAFNASRYSTTELVNKWAGKGAVIGIYDYFSQFTFDFDMPGISQASQKNTLYDNIRKYHKMGVVGYEGQSSVGWISKGLGFYIAAQTMWDVSTDVERSRKLFFEQCFKKASPLMKTLWGLWETNGFNFIREKDLARWIDIVHEAEKIELSPLVHKRLFHVKTYLHYLQLYRNYRLTKSADDLLKLLNFGFRTLEFGSVIGYPAFFELGGTSGIPDMGFSANAKWRSNDGSVTTAEMNALLRQDRQQLKGSDPVAEFVPARSFTTVKRIDLSNKLFSDSSQINNAFWMIDEWVIEIKTKGAANYIDFTGDYIGDKNQIKPIKLTFYNYTATGPTEFSTPLLNYDYTAKMVKEKISLESLPPGFYTLVINDPVKIYRLKFSPVVNYSLVMRPNRHIQTTALNYAFIYVPEGVRKFNVSKGKILNLVTPTGRAINMDNEAIPENVIEVKPGEAGLWRIKLLADYLYVEGIPPYVGTSPWQMLIPDPKSKSQ